MRRLVVVAVVVAALGGAGVAGAVVVGPSLTTIRQGQWARLGTTETYCQAITENAANNFRPAFDCGDWEGSSHRSGTYSAILDQLGVEVDQWTGYGKNERSHRVVTYLNP
jgi:hypothetical protein